MIRAVLVGLVLAVALGGCQKDESRVVVEAETPDGHAFYFMPVYEDEVTDVFVKIAWPSDWAYRPDVPAGAQYVAAETLLSGGTATTTPQDVLELFEDRNARGRIYATSDYVFGELGFPKEYTDEIVPLAAEMLAQPQFSPNWVERVKYNLQATQAEILTQSDSQMWAAARLLVLGDTPLNTNLTMADPELYSAITIEDLRDWHQQTLVRAGTKIVVTGAVDQEAAAAIVDQLLAGLSQGPATPAPEIITNFAPKSVLLHLPAAEKSSLGFVGKLPATAERGDVYDLLALSLFGDQNGGPLMAALRTELRASYSFMSGYDNYDRRNRILVMAGEVDTERLAEAAEVVRHTYADFTTATTFEGFGTLQNDIVTGTEANLNYINVSGNVILEYALDGYENLAPEQLVDAIRTATVQNLRDRMADAFPAAGDLILFAVSPDAEALPGACVITEVAQVLTCP